ncbi:Zds1p [Saccharomyces paradoxus]|uniref:Zds1p n=1 Tax=Saccharomyces paradoxus TaxID=27291 RepID=A0A8B8UXT0_SACPA|nr:Zds1 [Saccharomyces paradoxus]QHS75543.1 Zds1 [Saccharomyces paradoxus]
MSNRNNESMLRATSNNKATANQRDKRKSEVLIAAQSLDNEIRSVKNLKRLSIGSMDLLIDPELDIKFGGESNGRRSWSGMTSSSVSMPSGTSSVNNTRYSDPTPLENLHERSDSGMEYPNKSKQGNNIGNKKGVHSPSRKLNANALKKNLLWVPANQHPNVKPDNFLELVQDTLQNIQLSENDDTNEDNDENNDENNDNENDKEEKESKSYENKENKTINLNRGLSRHGNASLIRRPSTLRRSYTEFDDNEDDNSQGDRDFKTVNEVDERTSTIKERPVSLRDITEELTKISNSAGLTDNDAITLARTLSMAGSYSDKKDEPQPEGHYGERDIGVTTSQANTSDDGEFASNMPINNNMTWPERSSLRRSRFNTYRIRSQEQEKEVEQDVEEIKNDEVERLHLAKNTTKVGIDPHKSPFRQQDEESENMSSPGSIGDFQDIYNHYRQSSGEWEQEMGIEKEAEVVPVKVQDDIVEQDLELREESAGTIKQSATDDNKETKRHRRRNGWTWLNNKMNRDEDNEENQGDDENDENVDSRRMELENSKKHYISLFNGGEKTEALNKEEMNNANASTTTSQTRQKIEKTFANLFRRKPHHKHEESLSPSSSPSSSPPIPNNDTVHVRERKLKKLGSKNGREPVEPILLHNRPRLHRHHHSRHGSQKTSVKVLKDTQSQSQSQSQSQLQPQPQQQIPLQSQLEGAIEVEKKEESDSESLPQLQPAVSVSSTKSNPRDREEEETKKRTKKRSNTIEISNEQRSRHVQKENTHEQKAQLQAPAQEQVQASAPVQASTPAQAQAQAQTQDQAQGQVQAQAAPPLRHTSVLPPRKLTFADVKKSDKPNSPVQFTDSAFGFPLPLLTVSTVIMFDHRLPINVERAIYRLSHLKLSNSKRGLREQVLLSNFMYAYLNLVNHTLYMEQVAHDKEQQQQQQQP